MRKVMLIDVVRKKDVKDKSQLYLVQLGASASASRGNYQNYLVTKLQHRGRPTRECQHINVSYCFGPT
jgi:hypothetical protein